VNAPTGKPQSPATKSSWASLALALGCLGLFILFQLSDQAAPFERGAQGVLTGFLPRAALWLLWAGEALAVGVGVVSFLLIRREDIACQAVAGIVARSLCGIVVGLFGVLLLWLVVGHTVIGF
jgi:hypothetical protein